MRKDVPDSNATPPADHVITIGQLAERAQVKAVTIRYYEKQGLLSPARRNGSGYREYGSAQLKRLTFIRRSRRLGFTLEDIRALLGLADQHALSCDQLDARIENQLAQVRERQRDLAAMEAELVRLTSCCAGGIISQCRIVEALSHAPASPT